MSSICLSRVSYCNCNVLCQSLSFSFRVIMKLLRFQSIYLLYGVTIIISCFQFIYSLVLFNYYNITFSIPLSLSLVSCNYHNIMFCLIHVTLRFQFISFSLYLFIYLCIYLSIYVSIYPSSGLDSKQSVVKTAL